MTLSTILSIITAIPTLDKWFQALAAAYVQARVAAMAQENLDAIRKAITTYDQTPLENAIGSPTAGKVSGDAGASVVDAPPPNVLPKP